MDLNEEIGTFIQKYQNWGNIFGQIVEDRLRRDINNVDYIYAIDFHDIYDYAFPQKITTIEEADSARVILTHLLSENNSDRFILLPSYFQEMLETLQHFKSELVRHEFISNETFTPVLEEKKREELNKLIKKYHQNVNNISPEDRNKILILIGPILTTLLIGLQTRELSGPTAIENLLKRNKFVSEYDALEIDQDDFKKFIKSHNSEEIFQKFFLEMTRLRPKFKLSNIRDSEACTKAVFLNSYCYNKKLRHRIQLISSSKTVLETHEAYLAYVGEQKIVHSKPFIRSPEYLYLNTLYNDKHLYEITSMIDDFVIIKNKYLNNPNITENTNVLFKLQNYEILISQLSDINLLAKKNVNSFATSIFNNVNADVLKWQEAFKLFFNVLPSEGQKNTPILSKIKNQIDISLQDYESTIKELVKRLSISLHNLENVKTINIDQFKTQTSLVDYPIEIFGKDIQIHFKELKDLLDQDVKKLQGELDILQAEIFGSISPDNLFKMVLIAEINQESSVSIYFLQQLCDVIQKSDLEDKKKQKTLAELCLLEAILLRSKGTGYLSRAYNKCLEAFGKNNCIPNRPDVDWRLHKELGVIILALLDDNFLYTENNKNIDYIQFMRNHTIKGHPLNDVLTFHLLALEYIMKTYKGETLQKIQSYRAYFYLINNLLFLKVLLKKEDKDIEDYWFYINQHEDQWDFNVYDTAGIYFLYKAENQSNNPHEMNINLKKAESYINRALELSLSNLSQHQIIQAHSAILNKTINELQVSKE